MLEYSGVFLYCLIMKTEGIEQSKFNIQYPSLELNGENRLIMASNGNTVVQYAYDYMGRRFSKIVNDGTTATTNYFIYDGWNLIAETLYGQSPVVAPSTNYYTWGLDLSGTLRGVPLRQGYGGHAGGIGGLLSCSSRSVSGTETYYPVADGNGNITEYVTTNGTIAAHYEYNPFGGTITSSGTKANDFKFRFSTKYLDDETGLYYYAYRYYSTELGRWINRDPIEENGFHTYTDMRFVQGAKSGSDQLEKFRTSIGDAHIFKIFLPLLNSPGMEFLFVHNHPVNNIDYLGLSACSLEWDCRCASDSSTGVKQKHVATSNGCGRPGGFPVPDQPYQGAGCSFVSACNRHDCCYAQCGNNKTACDAVFYNDMVAICDSCTTPGSMDNRSCKIWAELYWSAVDDWGDDAYNGAQDDCDECCCP